ncbi:hypothetical protein ILUMI_14455 [Ignelater luminosus]|uniref:Uncharacterized protein n=1 Tax=Ignelater luminosus TaxID=2038154 RepID=A0A8K0GAX5_IGNLU|nr:hypothetical protein ILUMI_14455 [Ignelater luminosus]
MLQRINQPRFDDKGSIVGFDRKEVHDSLPRPICDPKYGKPGNQLCEPIICQPCENPDYPNRPCKIIQQIPSLLIQTILNVPAKKQMMNLLLLQNQFFLNVFQSTLNRMSGARVRQHNANLQQKNF